VHINELDNYDQYVSVFSREAGDNSHVTVNYVDFDGRHGGDAHVILRSFDHPEATILLNNVVDARACHDHGDHLELTKIPDLRDAYLMD